MQTLSTLPSENNTTPAVEETRTQQTAQWYHREYRFIIDGSTNRETAIKSILTQTGNIGMFMHNTNLYTAIRPYVIVKETSIKGIHQLGIPVAKINEVRNLLQDAGLIILNEGME